MRENLATAPVVVVDDVEEDLLLIERVLRQCRLLNPIFRVNSGEQCLAHFARVKASASVEEHPCLLLLDLQMSPVSGLNVLAALKNGALTQNIPVVMLSGVRDIRTVHEGYQLGAQTFLVKPITREDVIQSLSSLNGLAVEERSDGYALKLADAFTKPGGDTTILRRTSSIFPA
jgi:CheY-like chemotaxis protein